MPRLKQEQPRRLSVLIQGTVAALGLNTDQLCRIMDCSHSTALKRLRDPGCMTVDQLLRTGRGLGIPIEEIREAISFV